MAFSCSGYNLLESMILNDRYIYERDAMLSLPKTPKVKARPFRVGLGGAHHSRDVYHNKQSVLPPYGKL